MLEYIVDGQIIEVDPKDKNLFLQKYPNAKEQKKDQEKQIFFMGVWI